MTSLNIKKKNQTTVLQIGIILEGEEDFETNLFPFSVKKASSHTVLTTSHVYKKHKPQADIHAHAYS